MKAIIHCNRHGQISELDAETQQLLEQHLAAALVGCHATHANCKLNFSFVNPPPDRTKERLVIGCVPCKMDASYDVEIELVAAMTLMFHTAHEGHAMRIQYGDRTWESPMKVK